MPLHSSRVSVAHELVTCRAPAHSVTPSPPDTRSQALHSSAVSVETAAKVLLLLTVSKIYSPRILALLASLLLCFLPPALHGSGGGFPGNLRETCLQSWIAQQVAPQKALSGH